MQLKPDERFLPFLHELVKSGLGTWVYDSELWFYEQGLKTLKNRANLALVNDKECGATPDEKKFAAIVWNHFPELK